MQIIVTFGWRWRLLLLHIGPPLILVHRVRSIYADRHSTAETKRYALCLPVSWVLTRDWCGVAFWWRPLRRRATLKFRSISAFLSFCSNIKKPSENQRKWLEGGLEREEPVRQNSVCVEVAISQLAEQNGIQVLCYRSMRCWMCVCLWVYLCVLENHTEVQIFGPHKFSLVQASNVCHRTHVNITQTIPPGICMCGARACYGEIVQRRGLLHAVHALFIRMNSVSDVVVVVVCVVLLSSNARSLR